MFENDLEGEDSDEESVDNGKAGLDNSFQVYDSRGKKQSIKKCILQHDVRYTDQNMGDEGVVYSFAKINIDPRT